jgi:hypothetical protein
LFSYEEAHMKVSSYLLAILAFGALSTHVAVAGHHHGHRASAAARHSGAAPQSLAKSPTAKDGQQGTGPAVQRGIADHANGEAAKDGSTLTGIDKGIVDEVSADTKKSGKTNVSTGTAPDIAPAAARGLHGAAAPAPGASGKQGDAGVEIDTRITLHQGRETVRGTKERVFKKTKTATAPGIGLKLEPVHNNHQGSPVRSDGGLRRNAARIFGQAYDYAPRQMPQYHVQRRLRIIFAACEQQPERRRPPPSSSLQ